MQDDTSAESPTPKGASRAILQRLDRCEQELQRIGFDVQVILGHVARNAEALGRVAEKVAGPLRSHAPDFRSVRTEDGNQHFFSASQSVVVRMLWESAGIGCPDVGTETLLEAVGIRTEGTSRERQAKRIDHLFRDSPEWGTFIVPGATKGTLRLNFFAENSKLTPNSRQTHTSGAAG